MLMNLSRMRRVKWTEEMVDMHAKYKALLHRHDQDLINLYFSCHPGEIFAYCIIPLCSVTFAPPRKNRSGGANPINQSSQSDYQGLLWKSALDWLILHISGKIALRV